MSTTQLSTFVALNAIKQLFGATKKVRNTALALIRNNPGTALATVADFSGNELSIAARAKAFDEIIGEVETPEQAQKLVEEHLHPDLVSEFLAVRGGLPSAAGHNLNRQTLIAALLHDVNSYGNGAQGAALIVLSWAHSLKDRDDWPDFLEQNAEIKVDDEDDDSNDIDYSIGDLVLLGLWYQRDRVTEDTCRIMDDELDDLGFDDFDAAQKRLRELLHANRGIGLRVQALRLEISKRREERQKADAALAGQTVQAATQAGSDVDIDL
jgi:hypothetical protein